MADDDKARPTGITRRIFGKGALTGVATLAVDPAAAVRAAGGAALSAAAPALAAASGAATVAPVTAGGAFIPRAAAYIAPKLSELMEMAELLFEFDDTLPAGELHNTQEAASIESVFRIGLPLNQAGEIDEYKLEEVRWFLGQINILYLNDDGVMRTLNPSEITPESIRQAVKTDDKDDDYYDDKYPKPEQAIPRMIEILQRITGVTDGDSTLGELADKLSAQSIQMVKAILAQPQLMPDNLHKKMNILRRLDSIMDNFVSPDDDENLTANAKLQHEISNKINQLREEEEIKAEKKQDIACPKDIACEILIMKPTKQEITQGIRKVFLLQPSQPYYYEQLIPHGLTSAHIRRFCQELKDQNILDTNFRPASVETEWLASQNNHDIFGMRVSTNNGKLRRYLTEYAEKGKTIIIPGLTRSQTAGPTDIGR